MIHSEGLTTRQAILDTLKELVEAVVDDSSNYIFKQVEVTKTVPPDIETIQLPACFIYSDREYRLENEERATIGSENWEWYVTLEVWAAYEDLETILKFVHTKIYDNYTLGNYASWASRVAVDFLTVDPTKDIESMAISYRLVYRHKLGVM
jgi:hypothetical protein